MLKDCNRLIADFVWNDLHQIRLENLHEKYENGGFQLQDIDLKMKTLRIKWLRELIACDESHIEKFLSKKLIGKHKMIVDLKILHASNKYDKNIPSLFYKNAIQAWRILSVHFFPGNIRDIQRDWIYENILLKMMMEECLSLHHLYLHMHLNLYMTSLSLPTLENLEAFLRD